MLDLAVHARELELQALDLEHHGPGGLAARFDHQLRHERGQLGVARRQPALRLGEVLAQVLGGAPGEIAGEGLGEVELAQGLLARARAGDAQREEGPLGARPPRPQRGGGRGRGAARAAPCALAGGVPGRRLPPRQRTRPAGRQRALGETLGQAQALGDDLGELHPHRARGQRGEHGAQLLEHAVAALGAGVVALGEHPLDAKAHEGDRLANQRAHRLGALALEEIGGIGLRRQLDHAQLELALGGQGGCAQHRLLARAVGVEREQHGRRHARELADLVAGEGRAHQADRVAYARLVQGDRVGVALADDHLPLARGVRAREIAAVEVQALVVEVVVGGVEVLRPLILAHRPRAEPEHAPAHVGEREDDARAKAVVGPAGLPRALGQAGGVELLDGEAAAARGAQDPVPGAGREAHAELPQDLLAQAPAVQVLPRARGLAGLPQGANVVGSGAREQLQQPLAPPAPLGLARVLLLAHELHPVAIGEQLERFPEVDPLGLLHEREHVARGLAAEAVVDLLLRVDAERGGALLVERAQPLVARRPGPPQLGSRGDQLEEVDRLAHAIPGLVGVEGHLFRGWSDAHPPYRSAARRRPPRGLLESQRANACGTSRRVYSPMQKRSVMPAR